MKCTLCGHRARGSDKADRCGACSRKMDSLIQRRLEVGASRVEIAAELGVAVDRVYQRVSRMKKRNVKVEAG